MIPLLWMAAAQAAEPTPDRPSVSRSGFLAAPGSIEMEVGGYWSEYGDAVPALVKLNLDPVEPRLGFNLAGVDQGSPGLSAEAKIRIGDSPHNGFAAFVGTAVPLSSEELWWGTTQMLFTGRLRSGGAVQANAGLLFHSPDTGIALDGVPLAFLYAHPVARHLDVYGELATVLDDGFDRWILDGGLRWGVTSALVGDAAIGWDLAVGAPFFQLGLTGNLGKLRR